MRNAQWEIGLAGMRESQVRWRHARKRAQPRRERRTSAALRRYEGVLYVAECAFQAAGYAALTLGAAWLLWRFVP
jgi:hypothetical protein